VAELEPIHLLERLSEHPDFHTAIFFTYGADFRRLRFLLL
jgi:hypothetical protein